MPIGKMQKSGGLMSNFPDFLDSVADKPDHNNLLLSTLQYLIEGEKSELKNLIAHHPRRRPLEYLIASKKNPFGWNLWRELIKNQLRTGQDVQKVVTEDGEALYILGGDFNKTTCYLVHVYPVLSEKGESFLKKSWSFVDSQMENYNKLCQDTRDSDANLISQIIHDSYSLVHLMPEKGVDEELRERIRYQEKSNQDILMYIREPEMFIIDVPVRDFIHDSLDLIGLNMNQFKMSIAEDIPEIHIDLELFSRAFNEIVKNAIEAKPEAKGKIHIHVGVEEAKSPLHQFNWINFVIQDEGPGIPTDFKSQIVNPFFTTRKQEGHSGFGLTLANKIIEAHQGVLEVESTNSSTKVTISIPQGKP